jgi:hypothetical protein
MRRIIAVLAALVVMGAVAVVPATPATDDGRHLYGIGGPGLTIHLLQDGPGGEPVASLKPGVYWLTVHDTSTLHNFHIFGPAVDDVVTTVPFAGGDVTVKIRVEHGKYTFQCDPHASLGMKGTFGVGGVGQLDA